MIHLVVLNVFLIFVYICVNCVEYDVPYCQFYLVFHWIDMIAGINE